MLIDHADLDSVEHRSCSMEPWLTDDKGGGSQTPYGLSKPEVMKVGGLPNRGIRSSVRSPDLAI